MRFIIFKRRILPMLFAILLLIPLGLPVLAAYDLSPALDIIKSKVEVKKCGVMNTPVPFSENDFDSIIGKAEYITILTLPDKSAGKLSIGRIDIAAGQTVTRRSLENLLFTPTADTACTVSFTFRDAAERDESRYGVCTVYILEKQNGAPEAQKSDFETVQNISYKGFLAAFDPEKDGLKFTLVSGAKHGTVQLCDNETGLFMYTPHRDFTGRDRFSFRAVDCYGNRSATMNVTVHVTEAQNDPVFSDMTNHWAHTAAIRMARAGIRLGTYRDGKMCFEPEKSVSRGDFLAIAMIAAGYEDKVKPVASSAFADDTEIPLNIKGYAAAAKQMEIISGIPDEEGNMCFNGSDPINRCEASLILARLLVPETQWESGESLAEETVPSWAKAPLETLAERKIMNGIGQGNLDASAAVTRAQLAQIFCNVRDYVSATPTAAT